MIEFLRNHFRYYTANSWNGSTSYANNVKIHNVIPREYIDIVYELMDADDFYYPLNDLISAFDINHDYKWQIGFNGRSGGYLVLYNGGWRYSGHTTYCDSCGIRTWYKEMQPCHVSRCNGTLTKFIKPPKQTYSYPGKSIDQGEDFEEWDLGSIKERVELIQDFDMLCDNVVSETINMAKSCIVKEETIMIPKTVKKIECAYSI